MSYPAPTKPLWPEKPSDRPALSKPVKRPDLITQYPPPTSGKGIPVRFVAIKPVRLFAGQMHHLTTPVLQDAEGNVQQPTQRITYRSNNPQILVTDGGMIATNVPPTLVSRRGASMHGTIQVSHGSINTLVDVTVATDFDDIISD
jgi:hypothetical protein